MITMMQADNVLLSSTRRSAEGKRQMCRSFIITVSMALWLLPASWAIPAFAQDAAAQPVPSQPSAAPSPAPPAASEPAAPSSLTEPNGLPPVVKLDGKLLLNCKDVSLDVVLEYLSEAAGLVVVRSAAIDGRVTVMSRQPVTVEEAIALLDTMLRTRGYAAIRNGRTLKIVTVEQAKKELIPVRSGSDPQTIAPTDQIITQVIPVRHGDATKLKADLASLLPADADLTANAASNSLILTATQANIRRILEVIHALDTPLSGVAQIKVFQLKYANATNAARLITEVFQQPGRSSQAQPSPFGFGRLFMGPGGGPPGGDRGGDRGGDQGGDRGGRSGSSQQSQGALAQNVTASADERTNTLVVSAPPELLPVIEGLVKELDSNPSEEQAVFVYRLKNAQAANVEYVLNSLFGWGTARSSGMSALQYGAGPLSSGILGAGSNVFGSRSGAGGFGSGLGGSRSGMGGFGSGMGGFGAASTGAGFGSAGLRPSQGGGYGSPAMGRSSFGTAGATSDLAGQVFVVADLYTNSLLVSTASKNFDRVKAILEDLDRAVPQVLIKVLLAEVTHDNSLDLGAEFSVLNLRTSGNGQTVGTDFSVASQSGGLIARLLETDVTAAIRALATTAKLDVLSRPYILTSDNQQAAIMVGQEVPFVTNTRTTDTGQTINTIEYDPIGIILMVTPHINPQGLVTLDVYPEISTLTGETVPISETLRAPTIAKRSAQSRVAIQDGQTIVIGGLMEDQVTDSVEKVPLLGDIPLVGALFRRTIQKKSKTELLIFLTPHVAQQPEALAGMSKDEVAGSQAVQGAVTTSAFQEHLKGLERGAASPPSASTAPAGSSASPTPAPTHDETQK